MKNLKFPTLTYTLFLTLLFVGCNNEPIDPNVNLNPTPTPTNTVTPTNAAFSAVVDGVAFNADSTVGNYANGVGTNTVLTLSGVKFSGEKIGILISNPAVGTFVANNTASTSNSSSLTYSPSATSTDVYTAFNNGTSLPTGTITISSFDLVNKKISGTFSFVGFLSTGTTSKQVTTGVFNGISFSSTVIIPTPIPTTTGFTATVDGNSFASTTTSGVLYVQSITKKILSLAGTKTATGESIGIQIINPAVGTFSATTSLMPNSGNILAYTPLLNADSYTAFNTTTLAPSGTITVSSYDAVNNKITGTFSFVGYELGATGSKQITNGVFTNISFTQSTTDPNASNDSFYAKVDGIDFVDDMIAVGDIITSGVPDRYSIVGKITSAAAPKIGLKIGQSLGVGTYPITGQLSLTDDVGAEYFINNALFLAKSGSITITSKSMTRIAGIFQFIAADINLVTTNTITQGTFDVELP